MSEITQETQQMVNNSIKELAVVDSLRITTPAEYSQAGEMLKMVKGNYKTIDAKRKELELPFRDGLKGLQDFFKPVLERYSYAETKLKLGIVNYTVEQSRIRADQERKARELAAKEQDRIDAEATADALQAESEGNHNQAEEILNTVPQVAMPVIQDTQVKVEGVSMRDNWQYRIVDTSLLPREYMIPDEKLLSSIAKAKHDSMKIPGVEFFNEPIVSARI